MWHWETIDPSHNSTSGDIAKLFRNEAAKAPGALGISAPPVDATLLAREGIQNSWDAGRQLAAELEAAGETPPKFRIRFVYRTLTGEEKARFVEDLGLGELAERAAVEDRKKLGLGEDDCLAHIHDATVPLRILELVESATTGMYGPWVGAASRLYLAMVSVGFTAKAEGAGGSYGYGKSGLLRGSRTRTVVAHTCFRERDDDPGVTRRLLGMTYWGTHGEHTGFARFGDHSGTGVKPLENEVADDVATKLGIGLRDPDSAKDLGSTFLLVDPSVAPDDLVKAIERNWWPAIMDVECEFDVSVETEDGHKLVPRPRKDEVLSTFIRGYEIALSPPDNSHSNEFRRDIGKYQPTGGQRLRLGTVGLVADLASWSYAHGQDAESDEYVEHQSLVALVRGPRMVVEYYQAGRNQPFVRGTFVADHDVDDLLRQTEPKAHDAWLGTLQDEAVDLLAPRYAQTLLTRLRKAVRDFRKMLKPPPPRQQDIRLPLLDDLFRGILENRGPRKPPPPPPDPRLVAINVERAVEVGASAGIRLRARLTMKLTDNYAGDDAHTRLAVRVAFDEDGRRGDDCVVTVPEPPAGFVVYPHADVVGTVLEGVLSKDEIAFEIVSDDYDADWTAQLLVSGDVVDSSGSNGDERSLEVVQ